MNPKCSCHRPRIDYIGIGEVIHYERDHSHSHCYDTQEGHEKHLTCCICRKSNPGAESKTSDGMIEDIVNNYRKTFYDWYRAKGDLHEPRTQKNVEDWLRSTLTFLVEKVRDKAQDETIFQQDEVVSSHWYEKGYQQALADVETGVNFLSVDISNASGDEYINRDKVRSLIAFLKKGGEKQV